MLALLVVGGLLAYAMLSDSPAPSGQSGTGAPPPDPFGPWAIPPLPEPQETPEDSKAWESIPNGHGKRYRGKYAADAAELLQHYSVTEIPNPPGAAFAGATFGALVRDGGGSAYMAAREAHSEGYAVWLRRGFLNGAEHSLMVVTVQDSPRADDTYIDTREFVRLVASDQPWPEMVPEGAH